MAISYISLTDKISELKGITDSFGILDESHIFIEGFCYIGKDGILFGK
jgi:hypothetical protein